MWMSTEVTTIDQLDYAQSDFLIDWKFSKNSTRLESRQKKKLNTQIIKCEF